MGRNADHSRDLAARWHAAQTMSALLCQAVRNLLLCKTPEGAITVSSSMRGASHNENDEPNCY